MTGRLDIRFAYNDRNIFFFGKPFVGWTETYDAFRRQGLGKRRLEEANAYSLAEYGRPLHSDTIVMEEAERTWQTLCDEGRAEQFEEKGKVRFRFIGIA